MCAADIEVQPVQARLAHAALEATAIGTRPLILQHRRTNAAWFHRREGGLAPPSVLAVSTPRGLADLAALRDQEALFGPVASHPTSNRVLDRVGAVQLAAMRQGRAQAREHAWKAGAGPDRSQGLVLDVDASLLTAHMRRSTRPRPTSVASGSTRCWCSWTAPSFLVEKRWRRSCVRAMPGPTPPPTTSPCWTWPWRNYPPYESGLVVPRSREPG